MANDYAPRQFLRQVQIGLLREYFTRRKTLGHVAWDALTKAEIEPIYGAWHDLPEVERKEIESDFRRIHALGTALRSSFVGFGIALVGVWIRARVVPVEAEAQQRTARVVPLGAEARERTA